VTNLQLFPNIGESSRSLTALASFVVDLGTAQNLYL